MIVSKKLLKNNHTHTKKDVNMNVQWMQFPNLQV